MTRVAIVGAGAWGTALAQTLAHAGVVTSLWVRRPDDAADIASTRVNLRHLPGIRLDPAIDVTANLGDAVRDASIVVLAIPTHGMRDVATSVRGKLTGTAVVVSAAKGFELSTHMTMTAVLADVLGAGRPVAALSGPNIAPEIAAGLPAATVVASCDIAVAEATRDALNGAQLRVYSSTDVVGVEYGGALKNVIAIAAGVCDGIGVGDNGKAAVVTRGLAEMARLGVAAGAQPITFSGLTGLGDCMVTCMSPHSRNRRLGEALARGVTLDAATSDSSVAEGVNATRVAVELARRHGVDVPIAAQVHAVLFEAKPLETVLADLMTRGAVAEMRGLGLDRLDSQPPAAGSSSVG